MPRLSKIRITGARYDNFRKGYEDSLFDLNGSDEPDHTLFTLVNQGGKGVLMQLISQIVLPGTRWGRESGNQLISMFYDRNRNFRPYTFHVILEWKLDTVPEKWLITGVCVTAEKKYAVDDQEDRTGLNYFHYTIEHDNRGFYSVESLPVSDGKERKPADYDAFERFIDENGRYIVKYPMSQTKRLNSPYYEYLKNRGIHRAEWETMKTINKYEGGVSSYFSSATDNKSVIDRMLIPAITQHMNNYGENAGESLKEMFLSNLSITRDLPRLLERESDYRELLILLAPLMECAGEGCEAEKNLKKQILEGNSILATLNNSMDKALDRKRGWEGQLHGAEEELAQYSFENENLEYARYKRDQSDKKSRLDELGLESGACEERLSLNEEEKTGIEADLLTIKRKQLLKERQNHLDERKYLIESMGMEDLKGEIKRLDEEICGKWGKSREFFEGISMRHHAYRSYLEKMGVQLNEQKHRAEKRLREVQKGIGVFEERKKRHQDALDKLTQYFDPFSLAMPEFLLAELQEEAERRKSKISRLEAAVKETETLLRNAEREKYKRKVDLERLAQDLKGGEESLRKARKAENELRNRICEAEGIDPVNAVYTHAWAKGSVKNIRNLMENEKQRLDGLKTRIWEINTDLEVNNKDYWIPNSDILRLKQAIAALGAGPVQTGTEFLYELERKEDRNALIESEPLLPYGIVIPSEREWELVEKNLDRDILLRAAVPVFVRKGMDKKAGVQSVINLGHRLALDAAEYRAWFSRLGDEAAGLKESAAAVEQKLERLTVIISDIHTVTGQPESNTILKHVNSLKDEASRMEQEISGLDLSVAKMEEKIREDQKELEELKTAGIREDEKAGLVEAYVREDQEIKERQPQVDQLLSTEREILKDMDEIEQQKSTRQKSLIEDERQFALWKVVIEERLKGIQTVLPTAFLDYNREGDVCEYPPEYDADGPDGIFEDVKKRLSLDNEIQAKNAQIRILDERIGNLNERIRETEHALEKTLKGWRERKFPEISEPVLYGRLEEVKDRIRKEQKLLNEKKALSIKLAGELEQLESSLSNVRRRLHEKYNRQAQPWMDEDLQRKEFEIRRNIAACTRKIESFKSFIREAEREYNEISISFSGMKRYEELDMVKGTVHESLSLKLQKETRRWTDLWQEGYRSLKSRLTDSERKMRSLLDAFRSDVRTKIGEKILLEKLLAEIQNINVENFRGNLDAFTSMSEHFRKELETTSSDKAKAEQVREQWTQRAAKHMVRIIELVKEMVHGMVYVNRNGHAFPLIKLAGEDMMPVREEDILMLLKEHFIASINKVIEAGLQPEDIDMKKLDELMGDPVLFSRALRGRYPVLMVYKMTEKNEFRYARPHDYYYASWEAVNRGEEGSAEGSGGQKLSICMFMMMMLVNFKKRSIGSKNPWTILMMDNPFGQASAKHILDPVFEIADSLNFQIIAFAPPEIVKIDISKRFPVFWELRIEEGGTGGMDVVASRLIHGGRTIER